MTHNPAILEALPRNQQSGEKAVNIPGYDDWKLSGTEEGQPCNRVEEPDEDAPRGYRPKPCNGAMHFEKVEGCTCFISAPCSACVNNPLICDTCGEEA